MPRQTQIYRHHQNRSAEAAGYDGQDVDMEQRRAEAAQHMRGIVDSANDEIHEIDLILLNSEAVA